VKQRTKLARSGPLYFKTHDRVISLIEEVRTSDLEIAGIRFSRLRPNALFVIDDHGVRRLTITASNMPRLALALLAVCAPLQYWLLAWRSRHER
jgi:hypothetical protein